MTRESVMLWVAGYERAWRSADAEAVAELFTEDALYRRSPYEADDVGHSGIRSFWRADAGAVFTVDAEPVAVDGRTAVVRLQVEYLSPHAQQYRDLWLLRFAEDGRVADFEEWPFWPGKPYTAESRT